MIPSIQKKVTQCGGNACPRCGKCMDWWYKGDLDRDYKNYERDNKCDKILNENSWDRYRHATCSYSQGNSHHYGAFFSYAYGAGSASAAGYTPAYSHNGIYNICQC